MTTKISWCDETINPVVGCSKISAGCQNCYAENMAARLASMGMGQYQSVTSFRRWNGLTAFVPSELEKPRKWGKPRSIFISSMGDLFHESVAYGWIDEIMRMVWENKQHTFILLTKRPDRMQEYFTGLAKPGTHTVTAKRLLDRMNYAQYDHGWHMRYLKGGSLPNLVLGISVEHQEAADDRIPVLLGTPAAQRFISLEPMVGPVSLRWVCAWPENAPTTAQSPTGSTDELDGLRRLDGVILGGESGNKARPLNPEWVRIIRDQCGAAGVPFMFKQWGEWRQAIEVWEPRPFGIFPDGRYYQAGLLMGPINAESVAIAKSHAGQSYERIHRVGKSAGNSLDGRTHSELAWSVRK